MASAIHNLSESKGIVPSGEGKRFAVIVSEWNDDVTSKLLEGTLAKLKQNFVLEKHVLVETVPGCFELPFAALRMAEVHKPDAVICLGCVIRGETPHFDYVCQAATQGVLQAGLTAKIPMIFGVLTVDTLEQALERSGGKYGNKGVEAAIAALKMTKYKTIK